MLGLVFEFGKYYVLNGFNQHIYLAFGQYIFTNPCREFAKVWISVRMNL